jgi:nicotinamidase-related amidase
VKTIKGMQVCETLDEVLDPATCAVLVIDVQNDFAHPDGTNARARGGLPQMMLDLPAKCSAFIGAARELGVPVVHVRNTDLPGGASDSPSWLRAKGAILGITEYALEGTWGAEFSPGCEPLPGEVVITKHRPSAFVGTFLEANLRSMGVKTVVVIGEQTPGCVEATFRDAAHHDFYNVLLEDLVASPFPEQHEASLLIDRARHDVCTSEAALAIWRQARGTAAGRDEALLATSPVA